MMQFSTASSLMPNEQELKEYIHSRLPDNVHMTLNLPKALYTQEEADKMLSQALETWEYIKTLRK